MIPKLFHASKTLLVSGCVASDVFFNYNPRQFPRGGYLNTQHEYVSISVIIPVYNGAKHLPLCLAPFTQKTLPDVEIIVVNDHSTDNSAVIASQMGATVIDNPRGRGPAAARNVGSEHARGEILFFVDADVVVQPEVLPHIKEVFRLKPDVAALFGSYDLSPAETNFLSQYKNLFHFYIHQTGNEEASTFWAGCGAIRAEVFRSVGGFNEQEFRRPSIEDIELGLRLRQKHLRIYLDKRIQAKHLKRWTWSNLLKADIVDRAYPWSRLIIQSGTLPDDLNLSGSYRFSAVLVAVLCLLIVMMVASIWIKSLPLRALSLLAALVLAALVLLNRKIYSFFLEHRGLKFTVGAFIWHLFYYLYSGLTFLYCWIKFKIFVTRSSLAKAEQMAG